MSALPVSDYAREPADEDPKTKHVWSPDGRSLCDRRVQPPAEDVLTMPDRDFDRHVQEETAAPVCGSCLVLADYIRQNAAILLRESPDRVHPRSPVDAWAQLWGTRWQHEIDIAAIEKHPATRHTTYDEINDATNPHELDHFVAEQARYWTDLAAARRERHGRGSED